MKITSISLKKYLSILLTLAIIAGSLISCTPSTGNQGTNVPDAEVGDFTVAETSVVMAQNMAIGWNLGNTLDATKDYEQNTGIDTETYWGMPATTESMITAVKNAGFKTIRIPVSWHNHITETTNYTIDSEWMTRVKQIVDWAYNKNKCVIINIHHDNLSIGFALSDNAEIQAQSKTYIEKIWTQIATTFSTYDNRLVFEVLNEPRDIDGKFAEQKSYINNSEWWSNQKTVMDIITSYEQVGINAIRSVAGNENRFIMVPGYAASGSDSSMLALYTMPTDTATDKLLLSTHAYSPYAFAMYDSNQSEDDTVFDNTDKASLDSIFSYLKSNYTDKGIGVVMGEASATDKNNLSDRVAWATYYFTKAKEAGIPVVLWDNMVTANTPNSTDIGERHGYYNRNENSWYFPTMIEAMMKAVYGDNYTAQ